MTNVFNKTTYTKNEIDDKLKSIQTQIDNLSNNQFQIKRKYIHKLIDNYKWIECLNVSDEKYEYYILNVWVEKNADIYYNVASHNSSNHINFLYSYKLKSYYMYFDNNTDNQSKFIIVEYLQIPRKIKVDI